MRSCYCASTPHTGMLCLHSWTLNNMSSFEVRGSTWLLSSQQTCLRRLRNGFHDVLSPCIQSNSSLEPKCYSREYNILAEMHRSRTDPVCFAQGVCWYPHIWGVCWYPHIWGGALWDSTWHTSTGSWLAYSYVYFLLYFALRTMG